MAGAYSFIAYLSHLTIDDASFSRRGGLFGRGAKEGEEEGPTVSAGRGLLHTHGRSRMSKRGERERRATESVVRRIKLKKAIIFA